MAAEGRRAGTDVREKGDSDGVVADRFGGNVNWVGQSKRHRGRHRCRSPQRTGGRAGRLQGGRGGWCPERKPVPRPWRSPPGASARGLGPAGGHIPVTMRPSRQGVCLGVARTEGIIDHSPQTLEGRRDFVVKTDLPPKSFGTRVRGDPD